MFREMRRLKQQLDREECIRILREEPRGVLAVLGDGGYPYAFPMDHFYNEEDGCLYFHCAAVGHKMDAIKNCDKVSFCVYDQGYRREGEWALNIKSVIVFGRIQALEGRDGTLEMVRRLAYKYFPSKVDADKELAQAGHRVVCLRLNIEHMSGKLVNES